MRDLARLSINHLTTPRWSLAEAVERYARAGVCGIGLWPASVTEYGVSKTRRALADHGLLATSYCCGKMFVATGNADIVRQRSRNRTLVEQAAELDASTLVCVSGGLCSHEKGLAAARQRTATSLVNSSRSPGPPAFQSA
jgi:sugar phosphate isomerase/epimerase